jgi:hypothetical protein
MCAAADVASVCYRVFSSIPPGIDGVRPICQEDIGSVGYGAFRCGHYIHQECRRQFLRQGLMHDNWGVVLWPFCSTGNLGFVPV